jgi:carbon starvation protein
VALIALATVMVASGPELAGKAPGAIYGAGIGRFLSVVIGEQHLLFATTFGAMAFSTFVFDTLDVSTRLGRYIVQELLGWSGVGGAILGTGLTAGVPLFFLLLAGEGAYRQFWLLFGTSNQLLAALSLLGISVWLHRLGKRTAFTVLPMVFVLVITLWSLAGQIRAAAAVIAETGARLDATTLNGVVCVLLIGLAVVLLVEAARAWRTGAGEAAAA